MLSAILVIMPEPATIVLLGAVLVALGAFGVEVKANKTANE